MTKDELKPCPFCGGRPKLQEWEDDGTQLFQVSCYWCNVSYTERQLAVSRWNTRAAEAAGGEKPDRECIMFLLSLGFTHKIENGFHVVEGHGFKYSHIGILNIAHRIKQTFFDTLTRPQEAAQPSNGAGLDIPEGWKLVPIEPTDAMFDAFVAEHSTWTDPTDSGFVQPAYKAMLSAAPTYHAQAEDDKTPALGVSQGCRHNPLTKRRTRTPSDPVRIPCKRRFPAWPS